MLGRSTIEQVRAYPDIVGIINEYVPLKKKGRNHQGLCPFHSEKTPSFVVSPEKRIFHCFGCHASGDLIAFIMKIDNMSFTEAVEFIAEKAGIEVVKENSQNIHPKDKHQQQVLDILAWTRDYFVSQLEEGSQAFQYLADRKIALATMQQFHLGFAPPHFGLQDYLTGKGFSDSLMIQTGLVFKNKQGVLVSRFRNRVIFPVLDYRGRTLGFGGRWIQPDPEKRIPKYVNSEESAIFNKRKLFYGLNLAKSFISKKNYAILMEGYMDVITAHQYGFKNAVATMGTALTSTQVQKLNRFTKEIYMALDNDAAGQAAVEKNCDLLKQFGYTVKVIAFDHKDPADLLIEKGADSFQNSIDSAAPMVEFQFSRALEKWDKTKIENVSRILDFIVPILRYEKDNVIQRHYIYKISKELRIDESLVMAKLKSNKYNIKKNLYLTIKKKKSKTDKSIEFVLFFMATNLELRKKILEQLSVEVLDKPDYVKLGEAISQSSLVNHELVASLEDETIKALLSQILIEGEQYFSGEYLDKWQEYVTLLGNRKRQDRAQELKQLIKDAEQNEDEEKTMGLLAELQEYYKELSL